MNTIKHNERKRLPVDRRTVIHKFKIVSFVGEGETAEHGFYVKVSVYDDGRPGEIFITMKNDRTPLAAMMDMWAIAFSVALQHGAPLDLLCLKYVGQSFEPAGPTSNQKIPRASSPVDYIARWLRDKFPAAAVTP